MPEASDDALVAAFQEGDARAFDALVQRHRKAVFGACWGILRNAEQADEACQDAFVKAWHGLARFKGESSFKTWITRIAMNAAHDARAREGSQARAREEARREVPKGGLAERPRALDDMEREQELSLLRGAIARLPDKQRTTLTLKVIQGLKYTEIAEVLGCPVGTAKANFHHAVQNLRRHLAESGLVAPAGTRLDLDAATEEG